MSYMIERVSKSIARSLWPEQDWRVYEKASRAAIEAMREPTPAMLHAAESDHHIASGLDDCNCHDIPERSWELMIDAALTSPDNASPAQSASAASSEP